MKDPQVKGRPDDPTLGYTGFYPKYVNDAIHEFQSIPDKNMRFYLPGYSGYVP